MLKISRLFLLVGLIAVSGCLGPSAEELQRRNERLEATFSSKCLGYGLEKGTPGFNACIGNARDDHKIQKKIKDAYWARINQCLLAGGGGECYL